MVNIVEALHLPPNTAFPYNHVDMLALYPYPPQNPQNLDNQLITNWWKTIPKTNNVYHMVNIVEALCPPPNTAFPYNHVDMLAPYPHPPQNPQNPDNQLIEEHPHGQ
ncbi:hypothetical protein CDAR_37521 [Caerostris darwini]|uniref:Uncharacterized protein n=1 Tax=Caerostris darwini TaxID=1538125 RepID=A0AAV4QXR3_9ARAC|nr:hypothetical protein CDAR_37521 [Caerostris darwini]